MNVTIENLETVVNETITTVNSPYRFAKLLSLLAGYEVKPQMLYQYISKNLLVSYKNELGKKCVSIEVQREFAIRYISKNVLNVTVEKVPVLKESEGSFT